MINRVDSLNGKIIWITGASSGIGEGLAYNLASVGCKLILSATNESKLRDVAKRCVGKFSVENSLFLFIIIIFFRLEIGRYSENDVLVLPFNITDTDCHQQMLDKVLQHFNKVILAMIMINDN